MILHHSMQSPLIAAATKIKQSNSEAPKLTINVRWKLDSTLPNMIFPTIVAIVGRIMAPQSTRVTEIGSDRGAVSAGMR